MADISRLTRLVNGVVRGLDLTANTLVLENVKLNLGGANQVTFAGTLTANRTITIPDANVDLGLIASAIQSSEKGVADGVATLDGAGKVPVSQLPSSIMEYKGAWNASTNSPTLADGTGDVGDVYRVSVAGSQDLGSGSISFAVGDFVIYSGSIWEKSPAIDASALTLDDLTDVVLSSPSNGQALVFNGTEWVNQSIPAGTTINGLSGAVGILEGFGIDLATTANDITLSVKLDGPTIESSIDGIKVGAGQIGSTQLGTSAVEEAKIADNAVTESKIAANAVTEGKIANESVTADKLSGSVGDGVTITGGAGAELQALNSFGVFMQQRSAGVTFAPGIYAVRFAKDGETVNQMYRADNDASSDNNYSVAGIVRVVSEVLATNTLPYIKMLGEYSLGSSVFAAADVGKPIFLGTNGALTVTPPTATDTAVVEIGIVINASTILVKPAVLRGIN